MTRAVRTAAVATVLIACTWAVRPLVWSPYHCNVEITRLLRETQMAEQAPSQYATAVRARQNLDDLRTLLKHCPLETNVYMLTASNEQLIGRNEDAVQTYRRALAIDQRPEIYEFMGDVLFVLGRQDEAVEAWVIATRFNPYVLEGLASPVSEVVAERVKNLAHVTVVTDPDLRRWRKGPPRKRDARRNRDRSR